MVMFDEMVHSFFQGSDLLCSMNVDVAYMGGMCCWKDCMDTKTLMRFDCSSMA